MTTVDDGGPAFPIVSTGTRNTPLGSMTYLAFDGAGLSVRDWFAGQALLGFLARPGYEPDDATVARLSYIYADAMLAARKAQP